jgi:adenosylcobinamide-GDP ribazoletransferase
MRDPEPSTRLRDAWRLALGTLTALPVRPPSHVDTSVAGRAALLAPLAAVPLGAGVALVLLCGRTLELAPLATGLLAVVLLVLGTRAFHVDGLADTADGLTASYDRERSLAVMRSGNTGPAGTAAVVLVLGMQAVGFASLMDAPVLAGALVCLSRVALPLCCMPGTPAARPDGLGNPFAESVPRSDAIVVCLTSVAVCLALLILEDASWLKVAIAFVGAGTVIALLLGRAIKRLGGITGDIFGAAIELTLAVLLLVA